MTAGQRSRKPGAPARGFFPRWRVGLVLAGVVVAFAGQGQRGVQAQQKEEVRKAPARAVNAAIALAAPQQAWSDDQFEQWVFPQDRAAGARRRFDALLTLHIEDIDRACQLSDAQKNKLQLLGRGDIKRVFDSYEKAKHRFNLLNNDVQRLQEVMQDVTPLRMISQTGLFESDSLLAKALRNTLTPDQLTRYDAAAKERRAFRHSAQIELAVAMLEQAMPLRDARRRELIALLTSETKPTRASGQYEFYLVMYQIDRIPEEKIKTLLTDPQWKVLNRLLAQYQGVVPNLRQNGLLPDDDGADAPQE
jgi:hypothetical protein